MLDQWAQRCRDLSGALSIAGVPHVGIAPDRIDYAADATSEQRAAGDAILSAWDWNSPPVPATITRRQGRLWLLSADLLDAVEAMIDGAGPAARIEYETPTWYRSSPLIESMGAGLGKSAEEVDQFFREASEIA